MRKLYLLKIGLPVVLLINACKKSDVPSGEEINPQDAVAVSKAIRVWHGVRTAGSPPPANTGGPALYASTDPVTAANGRYAIIRPEISTGDVKGYYIQVNGAQEYFNIDYSKPRQLERGRTPVRKS
ncbi:MAG TPA: hypothetical protein VFZ78_01470, partial [Flavisolibacter sp.]